MGEEAGYESGYATFTVNLVNQLMIDCFECNNTRRIFTGKEPLEEIPAVKNMEDIIPFEHEVISGVMSYGLAYWLLFQDDENDKANICNANYCLLYTSNRLDSGIAGTGEEGRVLKVQERKHHGRYDYTGDRGQAGRGNVGGTGS